MGKSVKPVIVVSAINLFEGGTLSILKDCVENLVRYYSKKYTIIVLLHNKGLIDFPDIIKIEFPKSRKSYFKRLYYEYFYFNKLSKVYDPYIWISLHDITPNVKAVKKVVYCHNPTPFYLANLRDFYFEPTIFFFSFFYKYLYWINIRKNNYVIVQQHWINEKFRKMFKITNVITAHPFNKLHSPKKNETIELTEFCFFFPSLSRVFKNFEIIGEATKILRQKSILGFRIMLTIDGTESRYTKYIHKKYSKYSEIEFKGKLSRDAVFNIYSNTDCLLFPSKLETWGLPISEFKAFDRPIMVADLPYAHETIGEYNKVCFFNPNSPEELAAYMRKAIQGDLSVFGENKLLSPKPVASNWKELLKHIMSI